MRSFFTGVAVGFGVGLLIAPEAGSETRKKFVEKIHVARDQAQQAAEPIIESVRVSAQERIEEVGELVQSGMQSAQADGRGAGMLNEASRLLEIFNSASKTKLMSVKGIGEATARRIIDGRPYNNADGYAGILPEDVLHNLKKDLLDEEEAA
jgi:gas vesicle protein